MSLMTLDDYLAQTGTLETDFARAIGLSQSQVNRLRNGESWPSKGVLERIRAATDGRVTPNDFLPPVPARESAEGQAA